MKKRSIKILSLVLALLMILSACGGKSNNNQSGGGNGDDTSGGQSDAPAPSNGGEPIKDIVLWETTGGRELEEFFILHTENAGDLNVLTNAYSPLLELDPHGDLGPAVAKEWGTEDSGKTWTFKLRDDVTWVDMNGNEKAKCTAQDWLTAMEWILNAHKNEDKNTSMLTSMVEGAKDYYDYTANLDEAEAKALKSDNAEFQKVGIKAPDDYTLVYTCTAELPYFETVATSACLYPVSQAEIDEKGVDNMIGMNNTNMWYNGPYTITEYINNNSKILTRNPSYWDKDCTLFDTVRIVMIESGTIDDTLYETGEVDVCELSVANLNEILNNPDDERNALITETRYRKYSYQYHLNFNKNNPDGEPDTNWNTAVANENFRQALLWGVDWGNYWKRVNAVNPLPLENLCFTMQGLLKFSDGRDYTESVIAKLGVPDSNGDKPRRFDETKALACRDKAIEELTAKGVTFPVNMDYYIKAGSPLEGVTVMKECVEGTLGSDFINLNILTYVTSPSKEVYSPGLHSIAGSGWGADYGDVENFLDQIVLNSKAAYYAQNYTYANDCQDPETKALFQEFSDMVAAAEEIVDDTDARYEAFAEAEAFLLNHALTWPSYYENAWQLTHINDYTKINALYGIQNYTYKNWETSTEAYTAEDYARFKADFESGK